jgi:hypothetical protein
MRIEQRSRQRQRLSRWSEGCGGISISKEPTRHGGVELVDRWAE